MKCKVKSALASVATLAVVGGGLLALAAAPAYAAGTAPAWEPDADAANYGQVVFYDAQGNLVTSGTSLNAPWAYAVGATTGITGASQANLVFSLPVSGQLPSSWSGASEGTSVYPIPTTAPADVTALASTNPVVTGATASISNFNSSFPTTTTPGYQNVIQVRVSESGPRGTGTNPSGTYWESDVAFNTTAAPITVLGTNVPAGGWAQVYPVVNTSSVTLTSNATSGHLNDTTPLTLTATVTPTTAPGSVNFFDGATLLGSATPNSSGVATFTPTTEPTDGGHSYTASFVPTLGDITNPNTANAQMTSGSESTAVAVSVSPPQTATSGTLSADNLNPAYGATVNLTDTVSPTAAAGSVVFYNGTSALNTTPVATNASGVATLAVSTLPSGAASITAVFTPTSNTYTGNTSNAVVVTVQQQGACALTGSSCSDPQTITATVDPGTLTITTPYTAAKPFNLGALTMDPSGTFLSASAPFPNTAAGDNPITVTSSLAGDPGWTVSVAATNLSDPAGDVIPAAGLGLTNGSQVNPRTDGYDKVTFTTGGIPAHNPYGTMDQNTGLGTTPQTWASAAKGSSLGTAQMTGQLSLLAATSTPAGTYSGTITFSVI